MTAISEGEQKALDALAAKYRTKNARREQLEREAAERIASELAALEQEIADEAATLVATTKVSKRRVFMAFGIAQLTLDNLLARGVVNQAQPVAVTSAAQPTSAPDRPQFAILNGLLHVSTEEHAAETLWMRLDDGSIMFDPLTKEWSDDWQVQNKVVTALANSGSPLYAEAVAFVEEWEKDNG